VVDFADAAYFYARFFLALVTGISAVFTLRYGLEMHGHAGRRTMAFAGAGLLAVDVVLSSYDAVYNGFLTPGTPIALINWLWLFASTCCCRSGPSCCCTPNGSVTRERRNWRAWPSPTC